MRNSQFNRNGYSLFKCQNSRPSEGGLIPYDEVVIPFLDDIFSAAGITLEWPQPQLFVGKEKCFLLTRTRIFMFNPDDPNNSLTELQTYDVDTGNAVNISPGSYWHLIDLGQAWFLTNGVDVVYWTFKEIMLGNASKVWVKKDFPIASGTYHKGRVVFGGFDYNKFWNSSWQTFWNTWIKKKHDTGLDFDVPKPEGEVLAPIGPNFLWWSSIGGGDILFLFLQSLAESGFTSTEYDEDNPFILDFMKTNTWGFSPLPYIGRVVKVLPLGDALVAYSENGVTALRGVTSPEPTYSFKPIGSIGPVNGSAVGGDDRGHLFVDAEGAVHRVTADLKLEYLGYEEYFSSYKNDDITVTPVEHEQGNIYIGTRDETFVFDSRGLHSSSQILTGATKYRGQVWGLGSRLDEKANCEIGIDLNQLELPGQVTLESVQLLFEERHTHNLDKITTTVAIEFKYQEDTAWRITEYKPVNLEGWVYFPVTAVEFRVRVRCDHFERFHLSELSVNAKFGDLRYRRSVDISAITS